MSGATARRAAAPTGRPTPGPRLRRLALVAPVRRPAPRAPFVVLVTTLLVAGLAGLLFLHTALAEDSFRLHDLQTRASALDDDEQLMQQQLSLAASPHELAERAAALGMVRAENPAFIRLSDGVILGKPKAGVAPPPPPAPVTKDKKDKKKGDKKKDPKGEQGKNHDDKNHDDKNHDDGKKKNKPAGGST